MPKPKVYKAPIYKAPIVYKGGYMYKNDYKNEADPEGKNNGLFYCFLSFNNFVFGFTKFCFQLNFKPSLTSKSTLVEISQLGFYIFILLKSLN